MSEQQPTYDPVFERFTATAEQLERLITLGVNQERERIRANILDRVTDLKSCSKQDNCQELGNLIESYIDEWLDNG